MFPVGYLFLLTTVTLSASEYIKVNRGIEVAYGRSVTLDPSRLKISVEEGDRCLVRVVQHPLSQRLGRLYPRLFPCEFSLGSITYTHFGSTNPSRERLSLLLRYDTFNSTVIIPFTVQVKVLFTRMEIVGKNTPLMLPAASSISSPIDRSTLQFNHDRRIQHCRVWVMESEGSLPRYGEVVRGNPTDGEGQDCDEFLQAGLHYHRLPLGGEPDRDYIPMMVELSDNQYNLVSKEHFQVVVRLPGGSNTPPVVGHDALLLLDAHPFSLTPLTPDILSAWDNETAAARLVFNITVPLSPRDGEFVSTDDSSLPVTAFTQQDLMDLKIAYRPPNHGTNLRKMMEIRFQVLDDEGLASEDSPLGIVLKSVNTRSPTATKNTGLTLFEGQSRIISSSFLEVSDEDNIDDVLISVIGGLRHGELLVGRVPAREFTPEELNSGQVVYQHDDSDSYSDNIIFRLNDGEHQVDLLFPVTIFPEDDQPPLLIVNIEVNMQKGETVPITPYQLSATDPDSEVSTILYQLRPPSHGDVLLRQITQPEDAETWNFKDGWWEKITLQFTQEDLVLGKVWYRHDNSDITQTVSDRIIFTLQDDNEPTNVSPEHSFIVIINAKDDSPPELHPEATLELTVLESMLTPITKQSLRYTDTQTKDRKLKYTIVVEPFDTDPDSLIDGGKLVLTHHPSKTVDTFTQTQINHNRISYQPPHGELGLESRVMRFVFQVEDEAGNVVVDQYFTIHLALVNNKPPRIRNTGFSVYENQAVVLTRAMLDASDIDTRPEDIIFKVVRIPRNGFLKMNLVPDIVRPGQLFTKMDIQNGRIAYISKGNGSGKDMIGLEVSDGVHVIPIIVPITIMTEPSVYPKHLGISQISVPEGGQTQLSSQLLNATNQDLQKYNMAFWIKDGPFHGSVVTDGRLVDKFITEELLAGRVWFVHNGEEIGKDTQSDSFNLIIANSDMSLEYIRSQSFEVQVKVTVEPVDSLPPLVSVGVPLEATEGGKAVISDENIFIRDADSAPQNIRCFILLQPSRGFLENLAPAIGAEASRDGVPVNSFHLADLEENLVYYVQSVHEGSEPTEDSFTFHCSDGINFSGEMLLNISIIPVNDETPEMFMREFVVTEGMDLMIDLPILNAMDADIPADELTFQVITPPKHGKIIKQSFDSPIVNVTQFTLQDLQDEHYPIFYMHDNSESTKDSFVLELSDGNPNHTISRECHIMVIPEDDEIPRVITNTGLDLMPGETRIITDRILKAEDLDSPNEFLVYIVRMAPREGRLVYFDIENNVPVTNLTKGHNFTQTDVNSAAIQYIHNGREGVRDLIKFDITDGKNILIDRYFHINIESFDSIYPDVINKGVELPEGGKVTLTTDILSTTDINSRDHELKFIITTVPKRGHLENSDYPGLPITEFLQLDLAGNKISYVHSSEEETKIDSFEFEVTDGFNSIYRTFRISLTDVDNKIPVLFVSRAIVEEGGMTLISPFEINIDDPDTEPSKILFTVVQVPAHGELLYNQTFPVRQFSQSDLNKNLIWYSHDGSETLEDSVGFTVTDGTHIYFYVFPNVEEMTQKPQNLPIRILPIDNARPQLAVKNKVTSLNTIHDNIHCVQLTEKYLKAEDQDTEDNDILYVIIAAPSEGALWKGPNMEELLSNFTQGDITSGNVWYILKEDNTATNDTFSFKLQDTGGNELLDQTFQLQWTWLAFGSEAWEIAEKEKDLKIPILRRGYLSSTTFVTIQVKNNSAIQGADFTVDDSNQVQFSPGQTLAWWHLFPIDDHKWEGHETMFLQLQHPVAAILESPSFATITIADSGDESYVYIPEAKYIVGENVGELLIPVRRKGDLSRHMQITCFTQSDTASGTDPKSLGSYSDYISRPNDHTSAIRFQPGQDVSVCPVIIIDDSLDEDEEKFSVILAQPLGGRMDEFNRTQVDILKDSNDVAIIYFDAELYETRESGSFIDVSVWRMGSDLDHTSTVTVRSSPTDPPQARAGWDYVGVGETLTFEPGVMLQTVRVRILDDLGNPRLEGEERFHLVLRLPKNAILGDPSKTTVVINDTLSDLPKIKFMEEIYEVEEGEAVVSQLIRHGDVTVPAAVRCYTRQDSATALKDFEERPNSNKSLILFSPGERKAECRVALVDDTVWEGKKGETFRLVLGSPVNGTVGLPSTAVITILDDNDEPTVLMEKNRITIREPDDSNDISRATLKVQRKGDMSKEVTVKVHTRDGSATSGKDYLPFHKELKFAPNVSSLNVDVEVLHDRETELRESFLVLLRQNSPKTVALANKKTIIYIQEREAIGGVTFPSPPVVMSLQDFGDSSTLKENPIPGYPVICVTACNPKHPEFAQTGTLCATEHINNTLTEFSWMVSAPGTGSVLTQLTQETFFTSTHSLVLDSIYFSSGSQVICKARAVSDEGQSGMEISSLPVAIAKEGGPCAPHFEGAIGAEPFTARARYINEDEDDEVSPQLVKLSVVIPHVDGMLPVISTRPLSNPHFTLSPNALRLGQHHCSNLIQPDESEHAHRGFLTTETRPEKIAGETQPYQYDVTLRTQNALRFYKNLNLETCLWTWNAYYNMSELVNECGATVISDGTPVDLVQSYMSVQLPLHVSYVFHSPVATGGWMHHDLHSQLSLAFVYDTSVLWQDGIRSPPGSSLEGKLYPTAMKIHSDGTLEVTVKTQPNFRGKFLLSHPLTSHTSDVTSKDHPELTFTLRLLNTGPSPDQPQQTWQFTSDFAKNMTDNVRDYSGEYTVSLLPCVMELQEIEEVVDDRRSNMIEPSPCYPRQLISFPLNIRFTQVSDPVPTRYTLNTQFLLDRDPNLWKQGESLIKTDAAFFPGDKVYGKIMVDPVQSLGNAFHLRIDKCYVCTGVDGYIPKYKPETGNYGCVADSPKLLHHFKIIDSDSPSTVEVDWMGVPWKAEFIENNNIPRESPAYDKFSFSSEPFFQVGIGRQWFVHCIYTIEMSNKKGKPWLLRPKRDLDDADGVGQNGKGTNMHPIVLQLSRPSVHESYHASLLYPLMGAAIATVLLVAVAFFVYKKQRRRGKDPPRTVVASKTCSRVLTPQYLSSRDKRTEV